MKSTSTTTTNNTYLALDFGGTKLLVGQTDDNGNVLRHKRYDTGYVNQTSALDIIRRSVDDYIATVGWATGTKPIAMGVGMIGRVDATNGVWLQMDPRRTEPMRIAESLSSIYGMPCYIDNDVKSATRAEMRFGCGRTSKDFVYINVGTGISAGSVIDGRIVRGSHFNAGEVGHTHSGLNIGMKCECGRNNCVEVVASGVGFDRCARMLRTQFASELTIPEEGRVDTREIFELSMKGDCLCVQLVENAVRALANLVMNIVRMSDPDTVVLGGGILSDGYIYSRVLEKLDRTTMRFVTNGVKLTELDPDFAGLIGAGAVAMGV
jgi:predicted NBD/HSP70 family sugar kinase